MAEKTDRPAKYRPPPDWMQDMAKVPFNPMAEVRAANFAHSPCGMTPQNYDVPEVRPNPPRPERGERPLVNPNDPQHPTPGVAQCDRLVAATERAERKEASAPDDMMMKLATAMTAMMQLQGQTLAILAQKLVKEDRSGDKK